MWNIQTVSPHVKHPSFPFKGEVRGFQNLRCKSHFHFKR